MTDYGESTSITWKRAKRVIINNPLGQTPNSNYETEIATRDSTTGELISKNDYREFNITHDLDEIFELRNPLTGELLGATMTKQELFTAVFSCGWHDMAKVGV